MSKEFAKISKHIRTFHTYSEMFGKKASKEEIIKNIRSVRVDEALMILSQFTVLNETSKERMKELFKQGLPSIDWIDNFEAFDLSNILFAMKWFIAYGTRNPVSTTDRNGVFVLLTMLKISDYMVDAIDSYEDVQDVILKGSLFTRNTQIDRSLLRQHIMFEEIARSPERFEPKEYIDIHSIFEARYAYSIKQYIATSFVLNLNCIKGTDTITDNAWGIDVDKFFDNFDFKQQALTIFRDLAIDPLELKHWARETIGNPYDYELLLQTPIFLFENRAYPCSPGNMNSIIFEGLFFKIRNCFGPKDTTFFAFYGRLFENYVSDLLKSAVVNARLGGYEFIDEFKYHVGKKEKRSSDAYIKIGRSLLIVECKGGRIRQETKIHACETSSLKDFEKFVMDPIKQVSDCYKEVVAIHPEKFQNINKVFVLSVSMQSFPKLPKYQELINDPLWKKKLSSSIYKYDYIGINEVELFACIINQHADTIFRFINNKMNTDLYSPYPNYYYYRFGQINKLESENQKLEEVFDLMFETIGFKRKLASQESNQ